MTSRVKYLFWWNQNENAIDARTFSEVLGPGDERYDMFWGNYFVVACERRKADAPLWDTSPEAYVYTNQTNI